MGFSWRSDKRFIVMLNKKNSRRDFLKKAILAAAGINILPSNCGKRFWINTKGFERNMSPQFKNPLIEDKIPKVAKMYRILYLRI